MIEVTEAGKVIYKTEHNAVGRFPEPGDEEPKAGPSPRPTTLPGLLCGWQGLGSS